MDGRDAGAAPATRGGGAGPLAWALVLAGALGLRVAFALHKGLVLDEFHTWFHATRPDLTAFLEGLRQDNHPPLSFLLVRAARSLFGSHELALRLPALLCGTLELVLVGRIARRCGLGPRPALWAVALLAVSSLHLDFSTQARMYAMLSLCVTAAVDATLALLLRGEGSRPPGAARPQLFVAVAAGLHLHYYCGQDLLWLGLATLVLVFLRPELRRNARALVLPVLLGGLAALPWYATGFREQLAHGLPPGGDEVRLADLGEALIHLFFLNLRLGGPLLRLVFAGAGAGIVLSGLVGWVRLLRDPDPRAGALGALAGSVAFGVPLGAWLLARSLPRAGFTWHYVLPSAAALALLAVAGVRGGWPRLGRWPAVALGLAGAAALGLGLLNVFGVGSEDHRGAVRALLEEVRPGDLVICAEFQPPVFPQGQPYDYYAPRMRADPPRRAAMLDVNLADPSLLRTAPRVLLLGSALQPGHALLRDLRTRFTREERREFGHRPVLYRFEDPVDGR